MTRDTRGIVLILAHAADDGAAAVAAAVAARVGPDIVCAVRPAELASAARWSHRIDPQGRVGGELGLASGLSLDVDSVASVLNRVTTIVPPAFLRSSPRDRDYAAAEIQALIASWLHGLRCPVINPIGGEGPIANLTQRQWLARALDVGIPVARTLIATSPRILSPDQAAFVGRPLGQTVDGWSPIHSVADIGPPFTTVVVAGQRVHGGFEPGLAGACAELARAMGCPLLELRFGTTDAGLVLLGVEQAPALASAASVAAVAELLVRLRATPEVRR